MTVWSWKCGGCGELSMLAWEAAAAPRIEACGWCGSDSWSMPAQTKDYPDAGEFWRLMDARVAAIAITVTIPEGM